MRLCEAVGGEGSCERTGRFAPGGPRQQATGREQASQALQNPATAHARAANQLRVERSWHSVPG